MDRHIDAWVRAVSICTNEERITLRAHWVALALTRGAAAVCLLHRCDARAVAARHISGKARSATIASTP